MAFGSGKCTTRICGQTASISFLLISGILGQSHSRTAYCRGGRLCPPCLSFTYVCRGRWRAQPSATKERYGCGPPLAGAHRPSFPVFTGTASFAATPHLCLRRPILFCLARKEWGEKRRWRRVILRAHARDFLAAPRPERPLRAQNCDDSDGFRFGKCTTRICGQTASISFLLISGILGRLRCCTACCRGRCPHRPCKYWAPPANTQMACHFHGSVFCHFLARQLLSMRALSPRRRRCSLDLQRDSRVLATMFFYGVLLWHRGTIRSVFSASFCPLFLARQKKWVCEATATVSPQIRHFAASRNISDAQKPAPPFGRTGFIRFIRLRS